MYCLPLSFSVVLALPIRDGSVMGQIWVETLLLPAAVTTGVLGVIRLFIPASKPGELGIGRNKLIYAGRNNQLFVMIEN